MPLPSVRVTLSVLAPPPLSVSLQVCCSWYAHRGDGLVTTVLAGTLHPNSSASHSTFSHSLPSEVRGEQFLEEDPQVCKGWSGALLSQLHHTVNIHHCMLHQWPCVSVLPPCPSTLSFHLVLPPCPEGRKTVNAHNETLAVVRVGHLSPEVTGLIRAGGGAGVCCG